MLINKIKMNKINTLDVSLLHSVKFQHNKKGIFQNEQRK